MRKSTAKVSDTKEKINALKSAVEEWHTREETYLVPLVMTAVAAAGKVSESLLLPEIDVSESPFTVDDLVNQETRFRLTLQGNERHSREFKRG